MIGRLFRGACQDILPTLPPNIVQAIVTSPPYNVGVAYGDDGSGDRLPLSRYKALLARALADCHRPLRPGGVLALNLPPSITVRNDSGEIVHRAYPIGAWAELHLEETGWLLEPPVTWIKVGKEGRPLAASRVQGAPRSFRFRPTHERLLIARKKTYRLDHKHPTDWGFWGYPEVLKDTWPLPPGRKSPAGVPTFPPALVERVLHLFTVPGDLIVDPYAGEGTAAKVALEMGHRAWLIEREPSYWPTLEAVVGSRDTPRREGA